MYAFLGCPAVTEEPHRYHDQARNEQRYSIFWTSPPFIFRFQISPKAIGSFASTIQAGDTANDERKIVQAACSGRLTVMICPHGGEGGVHNVQNTKLQSQEKSFIENV